MVFKFTTWMLAISLLWATYAVAQEDRVKRGRYLLYAGGCISCHTEKDREDAVLTGGRALVTPFGTFYTPNITPDRETGIGSWNDVDFIRAFRDGVSPRGENYYPAFPYTAYTGITDEDLLALKAFLFSLSPVNHPNRPHQLPWYASWRALLLAWKWLNFTPGVFQPDSARSEQWNRGAYLVRHLGHCAECHTPRNLTGGLKRGLELAGNPHGPDGETVPNVTPDKATGIGSWSASDIAYFLETGMLPDGDFAGGSMGAVIDDNTSHLSDMEREAIALYLQSLPPLPSTVQ
jgi:mono/diheme cytochrome c family protein